jgi:hypothetical protein
MILVTIKRHLVGEMNLTEDGKSGLIEFQHAILSEMPYLTARAWRLNTARVVCSNTGICFSKSKKQKSNANTYFYVCASVIFTRNLDKLWSAI